MHFKFELTGNIFFQTINRPSIYKLSQLRREELIFMNIFFTDISLKNVEDIFQRVKLINK